MVNAGHKVLLRFASEMNGSWFQYGQDPIGFLAAWKRCITFWRNALGENKDKVAFIWSPNSGNGYPYLGGAYSINSNLTDAITLANMKVLDTNQNGKLDYLDDPYMPYYPGDDLVDWVGMSVYHYGKQWPWVDNTIPDPKEFENVLQGDPTNGNLTGYYPFYDYFSGPKGCVSNITNEVVSAGNKPLIISETAATFHFAWDDQTFDKTKHPNNCSVPYCNETATRVDVKQGWWRSFLNKDFVARFPQMKAVSTFEFIKSEELTWRDFTMFGAAPNTFPGDAAFPNGLTFVNEDNAVASAFAADLKMGMMPFLVFAKPTGNSTV
ncbi:glycoside hydrolase superfamily, partial [Chytriomyces sp. MP71]